MRVSKTRNFKKHYKQRVVERDDKIFEYVVSKIIKHEPLEKNFKDHNLMGQLKDFRKCHLKNDLLLIYQILDNEIRLIDIGTHADLFE